MPYSNALIRLRVLFYSDNFPLRKWTRKSHKGIISLTIPDKSVEALSFHNLSAFCQIAGWLTKEGYLTIRGKKFRIALAHSILKKRLVKEEELKQKHPPVWLNFNMEVVDKTILISDFGFSKVTN